MVLDVLCLAHRSWSSVFSFFLVHTALPCVALLVHPSALASKLVLLICVAFSSIASVNHASNLVTTNSGGLPNLG
jgi:hypothetical protein